MSLKASNLRDSIGKNIRGYTTKDLRRLELGTLYTKTKMINSPNTTSYVQLGQILNYDYNTAFSLYIRMKKSTIGTTYYDDLVAKTTIATGAGWKASITTSDWDPPGGKFVFELQNSGATYYINARYPSSVCNGAWRALVVTYDGSGTKEGIGIYVDGDDTGIIRASSGTPGTCAVSDQALFFSSDTAHGCVCAVSDVATWTRVLTKPEVQTLYNAGNPIDVRKLDFAASLDHLWWCGDGNDGNGVIKDRIGTGNGILTGVSIVSYA